MLFVLMCFDKPGSLDLRIATRPQHLAYLQTYLNKIVQAGPMLDQDGRPNGSLLLIDVADRAEAEGFAEGDPYGKAGLFEAVLIRGYREVFRDGATAE